jgi:transcriptional regulator with XRE-family HTH domain
MTDPYLVGDRVAYHRKRLGLSQVEFAALIDRSESWVSQVERGVRSVDRMSVLQSVADALGVTADELQGAATEDDDTGVAEDPEALETLRMVLTGHPTTSTILGTAQLAALTSEHLGTLREEHAKVWPMVHASQYGELAPVLAVLIPELERAVRSEGDPELIRSARELLTDTYQAAAAMLAKISETDAAWIAADRATFVAEKLADRAAFTAESIPSALAVAASLFRMAHVFLSLRLIDQAETIATDASEALEQRIATEPTSEALSLTGAFHLVLSIAAARDNARSKAMRHLSRAREIAETLGEDRNDYGTEFGPTNVALHAVGVAVELGDAGTALDLASAIDSSQLSPERQARYLLDLAQAHAVRRHTGDALRCLEEAERLTPEQTRAHRVARNVARDLIQLARSQPRPELREIAERFGVLP